MTSFHLRWFLFFSEPAAAFPHCLFSSWCQSLMSLSPLLTATPSDVKQVWNLIILFPKHMCIFKFLRQSAWTSSAFFSPGRALQEFSCLVLRQWGGVVHNPHISCRYICRFRCFPHVHNAKFSSAAWVLLVYNHSVSVVQTHHGHFKENTQDSFTINWKLFYQTRNMRMEGSRHL